MSVLRSVVSVVRGKGRGWCMVGGMSVVLVRGREGEDAGWRRAGWL